MCRILFSEQLPEDFRGTSAKDHRDVARRDDMSTAEGVIGICLLIYLKRTLRDEALHQSPYLYSSSLILCPELESVPGIAKIDPHTLGRLAYMAVARSEAKLGACLGIE